jgi:hypothetical protein
MLVSLHRIRHLLASMDIATYAAEAAIEAEHWWYVGRRLLFSDVIKGFGLP